MRHPTHEKMMFLDENSAKRLLVVRVGAMGDVLHALPAVAALRHRLPALELSWAIDRRWAPLVAGTVHRTHLLEIAAWKQRPLSRKMLRTLRSLRDELRGEHYGRSVDLQGTLRSALITRMSGAPRRVGLACPREALAVWGYTERVEPRARSVIRQACELLSEAAGLRIAPAPVSIAVDEAAEDWADRQVGSSSFALLIPTAGWRGKQWPAARFIELSRLLSNQGLRVLVNAADPGEPLAREIAERAACERVVCGLPELIALTRRAALAVGGDTGPMHLAAALGRPTVALFGPTDPGRNGPDFPRARVAVLRAAGSVTTYKRTSQPDAGLARLSAADVAETAWNLMENYGG